MKKIYIHRNVFLVLSLSMYTIDAIRFPVPSSPVSEKETTLKLRLPNELEMGFAQSPQKIERKDDEVGATKQYQHRNIHLDMNTKQLQFHFGVSNPEEVEKENYQVIKILPIVVPASMKSKKDKIGAHKHKRDEADNSSPHFEMNVFNRHLRIPMRRNDKLLKGNFKVVHVDKRGKRNEKVTKRMAHNLSRVGQASAIKLTKMRNVSKRDGSRMSIVEEESPIDPTEFEFEPEFEEICSQYRHGSARYIGAITQCNDDGTRGFVTDVEGGESFEVHPLGPEFSHIFEDWDCSHCRHQNGSGSTARSSHGYHVVVRRSLEDAQNVFDGDNLEKKRSVLSNIIKRSSLRQISMYI